ncbi:MAG: hypothetical protein ABW003_14930 [Microvirga sp.]
MGQQTDVARILERIAAELGVPVSAFHEQETGSETAGAMQNAVAALLSAFAMVRDPARASSLHRARRRPGYAVPCHERGW